MYLVWITNLSMNIIQTSQIKSNKMMVEKLLEKSKEKKIWRKTNIMFLSNVFWHFVLLFHSRKPAQYNNDFRILSFRSFYLLCSIRWPLSVINWMLSIKNELPFYNSLFFPLSVHNAIQRITEQQIFKWKQQKYMDRFNSIIEQVGKNHEKDDQQNDFMCIAFDRLFGIVHRFRKEYFLLFSPENRERKKSISLCCELFFRNGSVGLLLFRWNWCQFIAVA